jgi:molybdopterin-guanine dinucleotide biosynthesis protein MobB
MKAPWVSVIGWSGSGKTALLTHLVRVLRQRGLTVAAVKHSSDGHGLHKPGSDTEGLEKAGAAPVGLATPAGVQLTFPGEAAAALPAMLESLAPEADLVLVEGWKDGPFPKIEVWRKELGPLIATGRSDVLAVVTDEPLPHHFRRFSAAAVPELADFLTQWVAERVRASHRDSAERDISPLTSED